MSPLRPFRRRSLPAQLVTSYLVILGVGGLVTSLVGSYIVSNTMLEQERRTARHDLSAARSIYDRQLEALQHAVSFASASEPLLDRLLPRPRPTLVPYLRSIRDNGGFDFVGVTDSAGRLVAGTLAGTGGQPEFSLGTLALVRNAPRSDATAATEIVPYELLRLHDPALEARARPRTDATGRELSRPPGQLAGGMVQLAVAPVRDTRGRLVALLYAGNVLARSPEIVDRVNRLVYGGERYRGEPIGSVTIFQQDVPIATTAREDSGARALEAAVSSAVTQRVLREGRTWNDRAYVVNDWYVSAYEPIRNSSNAVVGMLQVGILQDVFIGMRDRVILSFFAIATLGFLAIILTTYGMIRRITHPLVRMTGIARRITAGQFDQTVRTDLPGEIGLLAESFNTMQASLKEMHADLEEWGRTLEEKVAQRTEELVRMQARVAQAEHLASLGMLAAGVAHEINNPLGGILALTSLTLEDTRPEDPRRENLEEVVRQTERCRNIVKGLLEFSRQSETHQEPVDLNDVLARTLKLVERQALFFNVEVVRDWQPGLPPVAGDRSELQQVFMNLIVNAVQSMAEQGVVTLETRSDESAGMVEVRVSDTGRGIPHELIDRIFDPFFTTKSSGQGTGLGLSIAYGIITKHGGTIAVESEVGKGTRFTVRFPVALSGGGEIAA